MAITKGVSILTQNGEDLAINDANVAHEFDAASDYAIGDHVTYCGKLYCFHEPHAANSAWDYTKVREILIGDEVTAVKNNLTVPFDETVSYSAGWYTYYQPDQALYRFTVDHAAGPWSYSHVVRVTVGDEIIRNRTETDAAVADLKSAIGTVPIGRTVQGQITDHGTRITTLEGDMTDAKRDIEALDGEFMDLSVGLSILEPDATAEDVGKALIAKTVSGGKAIEYEFGEVVTVDATLTQEGQAADSKAVGDAFRALPSIPVAVRKAIDTLFQNVAFKNADLYTDEVAIIHNWVTDISLISISAVFNQDDNLIYDIEPLSALKPFLTVTARYSDGTSETVNDYTLDGTLTVGTSIITVSYNNQSATFNVRVSETEEYGTFTPTNVVSGSYIDSDGIVKSNSDSYYSERFYPVTSGVYSVSMADYSSIYNWRISYYDSNKRFIKQTHVGDVTLPNKDAIGNPIVIACPDVARYFRLGWVDTPTPKFTFASVPYNNLSMEIGDIDKNTGDNITEPRRIRSVDYIHVDNSVVTVDSYFPFLSSIRTWLESFGYFFRCYDSSKQIIGSTDFTQANATITLPSGTEYVRLGMQFNADPFPEDFNEYIYLPFIINSVNYRIAKE